MSGRKILYEKQDIYPNNKIVPKGTLFDTLSTVNYSITKQEYVNGFLCKTNKNYHLYVKKYFSYI